MFGKYLQSIQTEARFDELVYEVELLEHWDIIMLNETWRESSEEILELKGKHMFY